MVCSLHSVTTGSRDRANVSLIIIIIIINVHDKDIYMYCKQEIPAGSVTSD